MIEGAAEAFVLVTNVFSGCTSDAIGKRKPLVLLGYGLAAVVKPLFPLAGSVASVTVARLLDRLGKGIRGAPRDALVSDLAPAEIRGGCFGYVLAIWSRLLSSESKSLEAPRIPAPRRVVERTARGRLDRLLDRSSSNRVPDDPPRLPWSVLWRSFRVRCRSQADYARPRRPAVRRRSWRRAASIPAHFQSRSAAFCGFAIGPCLRADSERAKSPSL